MEKENPVYHASVLVTSLEQANRMKHMDRYMRVQVSELSRIRPGTEEKDLIAVVVYPYEVDGTGGATAIALVLTMDGVVVWANPANEGRATAMYTAAAMAAAVAQQDQYEAYSDPVR